MLLEFAKRYPEITVRAISTNRVSDLLRLEADISLRVATNVDDDVFGRKLIRFVQAVYASPDYLERHESLVEKNGEGAHWITWGDNHDWIAQSPFPKAKVRHVLPEVSMQIEAAAKGLGLIKVPAFAGDADPRILRVPSLPVLPGYNLWLLYHGDLRRVARIRAFVDFTTAYFDRNKHLFTR